MKWNSKFVRYALLGIAAVLLSLGLSFSTQKDINAANGTYKILAWNDLGMHCYNRDFSNLAVLPPYNNLWVQVIQAGDPPKMVTSGITVSYSYADNTYSVGKTNFWTYAKALFGATLADNVGLKGKGLSGTLDLSGDHYVAEGIPLTEFSDSAPTVRQPYQVATVVVKDSTTGAVLATQSVVTPTSSEMRCDNCHSDTGRAHPQKLTGKVETNILQFHDEQSGTHLMTSQPVLCASCHSSNALGAPGKSGIKSLSNAMHETHSEEIPNTLDGCYNCHPGPQTRCLRDVMSQTKGMTCVDCHGTMSKVSQNTSPWLNEPRCDTCHNNGKFNQNNALYRLSKDHGGLYCEACHDSTHAVAPSREANDAIKFIALQGKNGPISTCTVCHTTPPAGNLGPHGTSFTTTDTIPPTVLSITRASANPTSAATVDFTVTFSEAVTGVDATDFIITQSGLTGSSVSNVSGSGAVYTVTANTGSGSGTLRLDVVDDDSIKDLAGNPLGGSGAGNGNFNTGETYTVTKPANVNVTIAGALQGNYNVAPQSAARQSYSSLNNGPVTVANSNSLPIVASERIAYSPDGGSTWTSYAELMGLPSSKLTDTYIFPWYNSVNLSEQVAFANVGASSTTVTVTIGGVAQGSYPLTPSQSLRIKYPGLNTGPVKVQSSAGVPIVASERIAFTPDAGVTYTNYFELMGLPFSSLTDTYLYPWYNSVNFSSQVSFANVGASSTTVTVTIGGVARGSYLLTPNQSMRIKYPGLNMGPVKVQSSGGIPIISSERVSYTPDAGVTYPGFSEVIGLPVGQVSSTNYFPWYNDVNHSMQFSFANVGTASTTVTVTIAGVPQGSYPLTANQSMQVKYAGQNSGPVQISSSGGVPIISSENVTYTPDAGVTYTSFAEMLGLPAGQLTNSYVFPWYNSANLNTEVRFGMP